MTAAPGIPVGAAERPATAPELGLMQGTPPPPDRLVTLANWQDPPFNRWGFLHVRELIPTARIGRGDGPVAPLEREERAEGTERNLDAVRFRPPAGGEISVGEMLDATYTDGLLVLHEGRVVTERYVDGMTPETTHLLMSVSKSLTATLVGVLAARGVIDTAGLVTDCIHELKGGSFEGCSVQHLLDMRAGTRFNEDYDELSSDARVYEQVMGWRPRTIPDLPASLYEYMARLENDREHGGPWEYRSILTDVLGWVIERAAGSSFAEVFSNEVWSKLGAEHDADVTVDAHGCALEDGGICTTLRDLARFGQMHLQEGWYNGRQIAPAEWVRECVRSSPELVDAFRQAPEAELFPGSVYHNQWWVLDPSGPVYTALGIHGQQLMVHVPARAVVAKFSTQPVAWDAAVGDLQISGSIAICEALAAGTV